MVWRRGKVTRTFFCLTIMSSWYWLMYPSPIHVKSANSYTEFHWTHFSLLNDGISLMKLCHVHLIHCLYSWNSVYCLPQTSFTKPTKHSPFVLPLVHLDHSHLFISDIFARWSAMASFCWLSLTMLSYFSCRAPSSDLMWIISSFSWAFSDSSVAKWPLSDVTDDVKNYAAKWAENFRL